MHSKVLYRVRELNSTRVFRTNKYTPQAQLDDATLISNEPGTLTAND